MGDEVSIYTGSQTPLSPSCFPAQIGNVGTGKRLRAASTKSDSRRLRSLSPEPFSGPHFSAIACKTLHDLLGLPLQLRLTVGPFSLSPFQTSGASNVASPPPIPPPLVFLSQLLIVTLSLILLQVQTGWPCSLRPLARIPLLSQCLAHWTWFLFTYAALVGGEVHVWLGYFHVSHWI